MARHLLESNKVFLPDKSFVWQLVFFNDSTGTIERHNVNEEYKISDITQPSEVEEQLTNTEPTVEEEVKGED